MKRINILESVTFDSTITEVIFDGVIKWNGTQNRRGVLETLKLLPNVKKFRLGDGLNHLGTPNNEFYNRDFKRYMVFPNERIEPVGHNIPFDN